MIQYKDFYLDLETDGENVYFVFSDTADQKERVWKITTRITLEKALEIVNADISESLAFLNEKTHKIKEDNKYDSKIKI